MKKFYMSFILVLLVKLNFATLVATIPTTTDTTCQGTLVSIYCNVTGATSSISYVWFKNNVQVSTASSYSYAATNAGTDICVVIVTSGSETSTDTAIIVVNPTPAITAMSTTVCSGVPFSITPNDGVNGVVPVGTTYSWTIPTGSGLTGFQSGSNAPNISGTLTNTTNTVKSATLTITPKSAAGCVGAPFSLTIYVNPVATITAMSTTVCSGTAFNVTPLNIINGIVPTGTTYSWPIPTGSGLTGYQPGVNAPNISDTLTNTSNTVKTATYIVTPNSGSCIGATFIVTLTVNPTPTITAMSTTVCSGDVFTVPPVNIINGIVPAGTTYSWGYPTVGTAMTGGAVGTNSTSINGTLVNSTSVAQIATYTVTPKSGGCAGATFTVTVIVNPVSTITNMSTTVCSGVPFSITPNDGVNGIVLAGTTYSWGSAVYTGGLIGGAAGSGASITGTITNPYNIAQTATYTVTPTAGGCAGAPFTVTVTVNPAPAINNAVITTCSGALFSLIPVNGVNGTIPAGTTYSWGIPNTTGNVFGGAADTNSTNISGTLTNVTNIVKTATYTVTPTTGGCNGNSFTVVVTINPIAAITNMYDTVCSGSTFFVTPANGTNGIVPVGTIYTWPLPSGNGITGNQSSLGATTDISGTLSNYPANVSHTATYNVTPLTGGCTGYTFTLYVVVKTAYNIVNNISTCQGDTVIVGTHAYTTTGAYVDYLTTTQGCDSTITTILTINPIYNIQANYTICNGESVVVGTHTYTTSGIYIDHLTTIAGCDSTITTILTVNPPSGAAGTISGATIVTNGESGVIYTVPAIANATSYAWALPFGATGSSTTNSITVNYLGNAQSGSVKVNGHNACGYGAQSTLSVTVQSSSNGGSVYTGTGVIIVSPNPILNLGYLKIKLTTTQQLNLSIYDITGRKVTEVLNNMIEKGEHQLTLDVSKLKPGIYFIKALGEDNIETVKFSVVH